MNCELAVAKSQFMSCPHSNYHCEVSSRVQIRTCARDASQIKIDQYAKKMAVPCMCLGVAMPNPVWALLQQDSGYSLICRGSVPGRDCR